MDALAFLKQQHDEADQLMQEIQGADLARKLVLFELFADMMAVHAEIEEQIFYPAVKNEKTKGILAHGADEHLEVKKLLVEIGGLDAGEDDFAQAFQQLFGKLAGRIRDHVAEEESELFPLVRQTVDGDRREELGLQLLKKTSELELEEAPSEHAEEELGGPAPI